VLGFSVLVLIVFVFFVSSLLPAIYVIGNDNIVFLHVVNTVKKEHLKELRTSASNNKATRLRELFGKTFSPEKVFVLPRFTKSANLSSNFFQL